MIKSNKALVKHLQNSKILKSNQIKKALLKVDRIDFVPKNLQANTYEDIALPITEGQTISQPTTVVFMFELLNIKQGQKILDIGAGSGWVTCLFAEIINGNGKVFAYEINKTVGAIGKKNITNFQHKFGSSQIRKYKNIKYSICDAFKQWHKNAPYDRIHSAAAFSQIPDNLLKQLKDGGILIAPTQDGYIKKITRISKNKFKTEQFYGFSFVPFVQHKA